jgi:hypothetical protein
MKLRQKAKYVVIGAISSSFVACGGGGSDLPTNSGVFINSPTKGIKYSASPSGLSGTTDTDGTFEYKAGDTVTFSLDLGASTVQIGSTSNPTASTSVLSLTPPSGGDTLAVAQVLETLDKSKVDGKMDVSGISLNTGATLTAITNAVKSASVSSADIQTIASGVQSALPANESLKYGNTGVTKNDALVNLSRNPANRALVVEKTENIVNDGSTFPSLRGKTFFSNWVIRVGSSTGYISRFGIFPNSTLTFDLKTLKISGIETTSGTYVLSNSDVNGNYTDDDGKSGTFQLRSADVSSFLIQYVNSNNTEKGAVTGTFLQPGALSDVVSKSYTIYDGCGAGKDNTVTINASGVSSDTCNTPVNGATWAAGPYPNSLQFTETNGKLHFVGVIRLNKNGGTGNLPSGATGAFIDIHSENSNQQPTPTSFKVN